MSHIVSVSYQLEDRESDVTSLVYDEEQHGPLREFVAKEMFDSYGIGEEHWMINVFSDPDTPECMRSGFRHPERNV